MALKPFWKNEGGKDNVTNNLHSGCDWWDEKHFCNQLYLKIPILGSYFGWGYVPQKERVHKQSSVLYHISYLKEKIDFETPKIAIFGKSQLKFVY